MAAAMFELSSGAAALVDLAEVYKCVRCDNPTQGYTYGVDWNASSYPEMQFGEPLCTSHDECPDMHEPESYTISSERWHILKGMSKPLHQTAERPDTKRVFWGNLFIYQPMISNNLEDAALMMQKSKEADRFSRLQPKFCRRQRAACFHAQMITVLDYL